MKKYFYHLILNWAVAFRALLLFLFHFAHGVVPCKYTDHEHWGISLSEIEEE